jgi:SNF2 family DNA or RNA helicase
MGLGKTVQQTALLAALLEKTGTNLDSLTIKERTKSYERIVAQKQEAKSIALQRGEVWIEKTASQGGIDEMQVQPPPPHWAPVLIVVPASITANWVNDFGVWGYFASVKYSGTSENRTNALSQIKRGVSEIMLCTHAMLGKLEHIALLETIHWKLIVIDEFHIFKNADGNCASNLRRLRKHNACGVIGLTGTLMPNHHKE